MKMTSTNEGIMEDKQAGMFYILFKEGGVSWLDWIKMHVTKRKALCLILALLVTEVSCITCVPEPDYDDDFISEEDTTSVEKENTGKALKANRSYCSLDKTRQYSNLNLEGHIPVDCGRCSIYNVEIFAWRSKTNDREKCWGLTSDLLVSSLDCMWKNQCNLQYTPEIIVWSPPNQRSCIAETPESLELGYTCLDEKTPISDVMANYQTVEGLRGLIRSHEYEEAHRINYPGGKLYANRYVLNISPPEDAPSASYVLLHVLDDRIDANDLLTVHDESRQCEISAWRKDEVHNFTTRMLRFEFVINSSSKTAQGFQICFQWFGYEQDQAVATFDETVAGCKKALDNKDFPVYDVIKDIASQEFSGFLRSHPKFPWNYPRPLPAGPSYFSNSWSSMYHVLRSPKFSLQYLRIQVLRLDLAVGDKLEIQEETEVENRIVSDLKEEESYDFKTDRVTVNFTVMHSYRHSSTGFLLCYKWYSPGQRLPQNLCDEFIYKFNGCKKTGGRDLKKKCKVQRRKKSKRNKKTKGGKKGRRKKRHHKKRDRENRRRRNHVEGKSSAN